jgi:hypothetical protein
MADKRKSLLIRIPPDLWEDLNVWARDELRSLNAQIEYLLRESVRRRKRAGPAEPPSKPSAPAESPPKPSKPASKDELDKPSEPDEPGERGGAQTGPQ